MAQLTVNADTDFRGGAPEIGIDKIVFTNTAVQAAAVFNTANFGVGLISSTVQFTGSAASNVVQVYAQGVFSASGWQFQSWASPYTIFFFGSTGDDDITGTSQDDNFSNSGGLDLLSGGGGTDVFQINALFADGSAIDGGAGLLDRVDVFKAGTVDLSNVAVSNLERLAFAQDAQTIVLTGSQIGGAGCSQIAGIPTGISTLIVESDGLAVDLTGVTLTNWTDGSDRLIIRGTAAAELLRGTSRSDRIESGGGEDSMEGGLGNDTYVNPEPNRISEFNGGGIDTVESQSSYSLATIDGVERLFLTGNTAINGTGNELDNHINGNLASNLLTGNAGKDLLNGGDGNDTLDGGTGVDTLNGGLGNDTYVDPLGDTIIEAAGQGTDTVTSKVAFSLEALPNIERLFLTGSAVINGNGNALGNHINGNAANNILRGYAGADLLNGGDGNDTLEGGQGNDTMGGGNGADLIRVANANAGTDTVTGFNAAQDRFDLSGGVFISRSESGGSTTLIHSGGTIVVQGVTGFSLPQWNALHHEPFVPELSAALLPSADYFAG